MITQTTAAFEEVQRFSLRWLFPLLTILLIAGALLALNGCWVSDRDRIIAGLTVSIIMILLIVLFRVAQLRTHIGREGITYRFYPFHRRQHFIAWIELQSAAVVKYKPLVNYGGWGIRWGQQGKAYTTSGEWGLELLLQNQNKLLIGTQQPEALREWLETLQRTDS